MRFIKVIDERFNKKHKSVYVDMRSKMLVSIRYDKYGHPYPYVHGRHIYLDKARLLLHTYRGKDTMPYRVDRFDDLSMDEWEYLMENDLDNE